jgi:LacI family repressor for deo operon, udp, cdd, tsx, nupC, and nupG
VGIADHDLSGVRGLTTVAQPVRTRGELASLQLAGLIGQHPPAGAVPGSGAVPERVMVPTMLVVRASTGPPGGRRPR